MKVLDNFLQVHGPFQNFSNSLQDGDMKEEFVKSKLRNMLTDFPTMYERASTALAISNVFLHLVLILKHNNNKTNQFVTIY